MAELSIRQKCRQIRETLPLRTVAEDWYGHKLDKQGRGECCFCEGTNPTKFRIVDGKGFLCAGCEAKGDVLTYIMRRSGLKAVKDAVAFVEEKMGTMSSEPRKPAREAKTGSSGRKSHLVEQCSYQYTNEDGSPAYEIVRFWNTEREKKECMPRRNGRFGLSKEERLLYHLDQVANVMDQTIYIAEGEKCADAMESLGYIATCNPFGCGEWKEEFGYHRYFEGRNVVVMPDADDEGGKWLDSILLDLRGKVSEIRIVEMPEAWVEEHPEIHGHDVADYLDGEGDTKTREMIIDGERKSEVLVRGFEAGISASPSGLYNRYLTMMDEGKFNVIDFSMWLPSLEVKARRGDLACFLAGTSVGKSRTLMNLMYHVNNINYVVFDLELGGETVGERWCALHNKVSVGQVQAAHALGKPYSMPNLDHIRIVPCGAKDMVYVRERIDAEEQITGVESQVIVIDYIGLMKASAGSRYERMSSLAEEFKGVMNDLGKVGVISSQRSRPPNKEEDLYKCPSVFDAKDSGSIENSSQELFGFWKLREPNAMACQLLKYSHGNCNEKPIRLLVNELNIMEDRTREGE